MIRWIVLLAVAMVAMLGESPVFSQEPPDNILFVQFTETATKRDGRIVIPSPMPINWFEDRPGRTTGTLSVEDYIKKWKASSEDFSDDPPNAVFTANGVSPIVVELKSISFDKNELSYEVSELLGTLPDGAFENVVFTIDGF